MKKEKLYRKNEGKIREKILYSLFFNIQLGDGLYVRPCLDLVPGLGHHVDPLLRVQMPVPRQQHC